MWGAIEIEKWKVTPFISGRAAIKQDVKEVRAVFYIPPGSEQHETNLPIYAVHENNYKLRKQPYANGP